MKKKELRAYRKAGKDLLVPVAGHILSGAPFNCILLRLEADVAGGMDLVQNVGRIDSSPIMVSQETLAKNYQPPKNIEGIWNELLKEEEESEVTKQPLPSLDELMQKQQQRLQRKAEAKIKPKRSKKPEPQQKQSKRIKRSRKSSK